MSKKAGNKGAQPSASTMIGDNAINGAAPAGLRHPPSEKKSARKQKAAAKHKQDAFSAWLDRALPQLQDRLAGAVNVDVTAPQIKLKN